LRVGGLLAETAIHNIGGKAMKCQTPTGAAELVRAVAGSKPLKGEDLLGDPTLVKMLREAKAKEAARKKGKK
jgi:hypothetical protein